MKNHVLSCLTLFQLCLMPSYVEAKKAVIITGTESSGSSFITRVILYVLGQVSYYNQSYGQGEQRGALGDDLIVFHRSQPCGPDPVVFCDRDEFHERFPGYNLYFIITTRDPTIAGISVRNRWHRTAQDVVIHYGRAQEILTDLIENENCFIWSYETQAILGEVYYQMLYDFLEIETDFFPDDLRNENQKYIINP